MSALFFYLFSLFLLASAALVVTSRNPVHAVLFLIVAFFNAAGLFLLAGAEFLAFILLIVYIGAVAVLFMFVVMMLDVDFVQLREGFQKHIVLGLTVGAILVGELLAVLLGWQASPTAASLANSPTPATVDNTSALGQVLYTDYFILFQISGLILLVAMIGAIVLTHRRREGTRRQDITRQQTRAVADTLETLHVRMGAGVQELGILRPKADATPAETEPAHESVGGEH
jgi:NADH-quinone oxidoreductase subunit J